MQCRFATVSVCLVAIALVFCQTAAAQPLPQIEVYELTLHGAVFQAPEPTGKDQDLMLELERIDGRWQMVVGVAREYNCSVHVGYITDAQENNGSLELRIAMRILADSWTPGGPAVYLIKLDYAKDGKLHGQYKGTFKGKDVAGNASGYRFVRRYVAGKDFVPIVPGEHPRTVFRKAELPKLRQKLNTPFGKAAFEKMTGPVGWAMQYQLTGDRKYAEMARQEVAEIVFKGKGCSAAFAPSRALGLQVERVAVALDLCFDAWPEDFKLQVITWLRKIATRVFCDPRKISLSANWNVASNHVGSLYAGVAFSGLVLWGEKGPAPPEPTPPWQQLDLPPPADFKPAGSVPVVPLRSGVVPHRWLVTEVLSEAIGVDPMASMQGLDKLHPQDGTSIQLEQFKLRFRPLAEDMVDPSANSLKIAEMMRGGDSASFCLYTVLEVQEPGLYKVHNPFSNSGRVQMALAGRRVSHGQVVRLEKGLYPLMILARILTVWNKFQPWLEKATEADLAASQQILSREQMEYQAQLAEWKLDSAEWQRLDGANVEYTKLFRMGRRLMYLLYREAVGTGGFQAEVGHYNKDTTDGPNRYATAYRRALGCDVSPFDDITHYLPRHVFTYIFPQNGQPWAQDINGSVRLSGSYFAALLPITPERWQPVMLWAWHRMEGVAEPGNPIQAIADDPVWGFVHYPLDMQPREPAGLMPLVWEAPDFGFYGFRNNWKDHNDIVTQVFLKAHFIGGWNGPNAGTFRIAGLGRIWAAGPEGRERRRWHESVVWLPNDDHYESALGRLLYLKAEKDGSGVLSIDLGDVYSARPDEKQRLYAPYGGGRHAWAFKPSGIEGMRSFAVDYSGQCGAPALFAIVDKIRGGKEKVWLWQLPAETKGRQSVVPEVIVGDNCFTIRQGDATLHATFLAPAPVKIQAGSRTMEITISAGHKAGQKTTVSFDAVFATGGDEFFVVATLQRGKPPEVKASGSGLNAAAVIGRRKVSFDGQKIVLQ